MKKKQCAGGLDSVLRKTFETADVRACPTDAQVSRRGPISIILADHGEAIYGSRGLARESIKISCLLELGIAVEAHVGVWRTSDERDIEMSMCR